LGTVIYAYGEEYVIKWNAGIYLLNIGFRRIIICHIQALAEDLGVPGHRICVGPLRLKKIKFVVRPTYSVCVNETFS